MCMYIILYNHPGVHKNMELYGITSIVPRWHNPRRNMWTIPGSVYCLAGSQADEGDVQLLLEGLERLGYSLVGAREVREMAGKSRPSHGGFNLPKMVWWFQEFRGAQQALTMIGSNLERERADGISHPPTESERSESITHHVGVSHPPPPHLGGRGDCTAACFHIICCFKHATCMSLSGTGSSDDRSLTFLAYNSTYGLGYIQAWFRFYLGPSGWFRANVGFRQGLVYLGFT